MSEQDSDTSGIKVVDKRRFSSDGESKAGADEERSGQELASDLGSADLGKAGSGEDASVPGGGAEGSADSSEQKSDYQQVDFSSFVISLATQALMLMGEVPEEQMGHQLPVNLEAARQTIDIIAMLGDKTKGNLDGTEEKLVADVLASLRMTYVNKKKG